MPRNPINYKNTVIYHFVCNDKTITDLYVGSTTEFTRRKSHHKNNCINENSRDHHYKLYQNIKTNGGWENWTMTPLEEYPCENKMQVLIREQYWIEKLQATMNSMKAIRTEEQRLEQLKQFRIDNPEYHKNWNNENRQHINEHRREKITCKCGSIINRSQKSVHLKTKKHILSLAP
jgi:hypothetical protein